MCWLVDALEFSCSIEGGGVCSQPLHLRLFVAVHGGGSSPCSKRWVGGEGGA
jgi:hypothetical protein